MNKMEEEKKKELETEWDFDLSEYENDYEEEEDPTISVINAERPTITGLRSRFSTGEQSLDLLVNLKKNITKFSIEVGSRQADITTLWKYYALLDETWEHIRNMFGSLLNNDILKIKRICRNNLEKYQDENIPPDKKLYNCLLYWRSALYKIIQFSNLGFETERKSRSTFNKTKRKITE